jgi:hypothetical protein
LTPSSRCLTTSRHSLRLSCDTVLTQRGRRFTPMNINAHPETTKCIEQRILKRTSRPLSRSTI